MMDRGWLVAAAVVVALGGAGCSDAREGVEAGDMDEAAAPRDSILDRVPVFPADSGELATSGGAGAIDVGPGGGQVAPGATPETGAGASPAGPGGPAGSSAREGAGPPGGDNLGGEPVRPQSSAADAILGRAASAYAGVRTLRADFEQSTENPVLRRTTTSRGTIFQSRPDRFAMRFSQPEGDRIVADGDYIWVYYPSVDAEQVIRMTAGAGGAGAVDLQAQFLGNPTERFTAVHEGTESVGGRPADVLVLTPRGRESYRSLKVWVDRGDALVRRFEITEHNGVVRRFVLRNLTTGTSIDASTFRFTPPEGVHVVARG